MCYLWYVGYGSNLCRDRFLKYILGGKYQLGGSKVKGCKNKTLPIEDKPIKLPYCLFFAKRACNWDNGGVAFVSLTSKSEKDKFTYGRMWKITTEQFSEIWEQEGPEWYNEKLCLGKDNDGIPIFTITHSVDLEFSEPSDKYLETIVIGLKETFNLDDETILKYLMETPGIKNMEKEKLLEIIKR